ncbi:cytochrome c oxidase assembly protein COX18, mitochondrial isoform X2 [Rhipicephalus microplus]|uniref:cytochrome c oxidase assembly protein COX18, mitochondrial isoform X2 n=1 Tax=Rhipicephalus microplus TaxID=6941 RepID=UPI003F6D3462
MFRFVVARTARLRVDEFIVCTTSPRHISCLAGDRSKCFKKSTLASCYGVYTARDFSLQSWAQTLSQSRPVAYAQDLLEAAHSTSGLTWGSTIVLTSLALRVAVTLPLAVYQHHVLARFANLDREMAGIAQELKRETMQATRMFNLTEKQARLLYKRNLKRHLQRLVVRDNCHPMKSAIVVLFQLPMWISLSVALRNMAFMLPYQDMGAQVTYLELSVGGLLWFTNLTQPDPMHIIPLLVGLTNLMNVEFHVLQRQKHMASLRRWITNFARGVAIVSVPIAWIMPAIRRYAVSTRLWMRCT